MSRSTARTAAMQMIFEKLSGGEGSEETLRMIYEELLGDASPYAGMPETAADGEVETEAPAPKWDKAFRDDHAWILRALSGVLEHLDEIDAEINRCSRGWTVERMPRVDLTILRLAAWEILFENDPHVPAPVAINEALEIAAKYSDPDSGRFINGVLGSINRAKEAQQA